MTTWQNNPYRIMDERWPVCDKKPGKAGKATIRCEAGRNHAGSCVGTHPKSGNPVFWGKGLTR